MFVKMAYIKILDKKYNLMHKTFQETPPGERIIRKIGDQLRINSSTHIPTILKAYQEQINPRMFLE